MYHYWTYLDVQNIKLVISYALVQYCDSNSEEIETAVEFKDKKSKSRQIILFAWYSCLIALMI